MGATTCGGLDCLSAALRLGPLRRSLSVVSSDLGTTLALVGILMNALGPWCGPRPIDPVSPRGLTGWHPRHSC
jgi:hypothetical protein